jgi:hypothetical protein
VCRTYIENSLTGDKQWRSVVLIKRTRNRYFTQQSDIEHTVSNLTAKYGLRYELFADDPTPSPQQTMLMFYRARVIVGPHGAGLSNMIFSRPGTVIIEGLCKPPPNRVCYLWCAYNLGHRYHGVPSRGGCERGMNVDPSVIGAVLEQYLRLIEFE